MYAKKLILETLPKLPNAVNLCLLRFNRLRKRLYGKKYVAYYNFLVNNQKQFDNRPLLLAATNRAINEVSYFRKRYGDKPINSVEEFEVRIGTIDKDTVLDNFDDFINPQVDTSNYDLGTTGGTSGKPLRLLAPKDRYVIELATMHFLWANAGFDFQPRAVIRNHHLPKDQTYQVNPVTKEFIFDGFRLNDDYFQQIYDICQKNRLQFIHCYPSTAYEFSRFLQRNKMDTSFIRSFFSGSENIFDYQVELIEQQLGIRFYNWYGHSEKLLLGGYCAKNRFYHMEPTYGYFELLNEEGQVIREPGSRGEIVGTSFHNPGMPFIRYRTGDFGELFGFECPDCGRKMPLLKKVHGRWSGERIYNSDGSFVTTTALNLHSELYRHLNGLQYVQERKGQIKILVVQGESYQSCYEEELLQHFRSKLNSDSQIDIEYVERLIRKPNGKFVQLLSSL